MTSAQHIALRLAQEIPERLHQEMDKKRQIRPCQANHCSEIGHDCERYLVYRRTQWQQQEKPSVDAQYAMESGHRYHVIARQKLENLGYIITSTEFSFMWDEFKITGTIDGKISGDMNGAFPQPIPFDVKSVHPYLFDKFNKIQDFQKFAYSRKYPAQLTSYLLANNAEVGLFILINRNNERIKVFPYELDYDLGDFVIKRAQRINKHVEGKTLPERIGYSNDVCGKCGFASICLPIVEKKQVQFIKDPVIETKLHDLMKYAKFAKEHARLDKEIKDYFKERAIEDRPITSYIFDDKWRIDCRKTPTEMPAQPRRVFDKFTVSYNLL